VAFSTSSPFNSTRARIGIILSFSAEAGRFSRNNNYLVVDAVSLAVHVLPPEAVVVFKFRG
jgi:hypothetical protein